MRYAPVLALWWLLFSHPTGLMAAVLEATVPPGNASANAILQCERIRLEWGFRIDDWNGPLDPDADDDYDMCATMMARAGVKAETIEEANAVYEAAVSAAASTANNARQATLNAFETDWPLPAPLIACGDSIVDTGQDGNEQCDDGGESATCNATCTTSACGDGELNVTAGEGCDDGNTDPGDGCDASCQGE